jgi:peptidoglycan-associated lipoprotein
VAALALSGCPNPEWPKCENDDHCKADKEGNSAGKDFMCVFGQCQECGRDSDCSAGDKCKKGRCEAVCSSDADCGEGESCDARSGECEPAQTKDPNACVEDGDCKSGFKCEAQRCVDASGDLSTDSGDLDCQSTSRVHFEFNVYDLTPEAREVLDTTAKCMQKNGGWRLTIEGHADERGTTQYNLDLGEKRARAVLDYLARLGVTKSRLRTVSYGEERPLESAATESAWAKNRRAELIVKN